MAGQDLGLLVLRCAVGIVMIAHGWNHIFGGGRLAGTARWFESIGIRPGWIHARVASAVELGSGLLLVFGLLTPLAAAGVAGTMSVALVANHLKNGFFIFRPGEGYEYVLTLTLIGIAIGPLGAGRISIDRAAGIHLGGWTGLAISAGAGLGGSALLLATCWRPKAVAPKVPSDS
jgi:putative oxidoreductase